ncbi:unnamed protein product [Camellia sinensis]
MNSFDDNSWDLLDYGSFIDDVTSTDLYWGSQSAGVKADVSLPGATPQDEECTEKECHRKRRMEGGWYMDESPESACAIVPISCYSEEICTCILRFGWLMVVSCGNDDDPLLVHMGFALDLGSSSIRTRNASCSKPGTKACRERLRRERLNDRFVELSSILEPGRPPKTDKLAILGDAIRVLNQLRAESQEFKETNEKLLEEIKSLKAEKNELRDEKLVLKGDKERMEQQLKAMPVSPAAFMPPHHHPAAAYHAGTNKIPVFPSYGFVPMWQYLPPSAIDTTKDEELRPPAA